MPDVNSKSPRTAYASRSAETRPNIAYPDGGLPVAGEEQRAAAELADTETRPTASVNATRLATLKSNLSAEVDAEITDPGESDTVLITLDAALTSATILALIDDDRTFATER